MNVYKEERPWGYFLVLASTPKFKIKKITIKPGCRLSLQSHKSRNEHWIITEGEMHITIDDQVKNYGCDEHVYITKGTKHRMENKGKVPASVVEIQTGDYFGDDDIIRYEDDYGRI